MESIELIKVKDVRVTYDTHEDHYPVMESPVSQKPGLFVTVQKQDHLGKSSTELLSVINDTNLIHYKQDQNSGSGWAKEECPIPLRENTSVASMKAFFHVNSMYSFIKFNGNDRQSAKTIALKKDGDKKWETLQLDNSVKEVIENSDNLHVLETENGPFVYGQSVINYKDYFFIVSPGPDGNWRLNYKAKLDPENGGRYSSDHGLLPGKNRNELVIIRVYRNVDTPEIFYTNGCIVEGVFKPEPECSFGNWGNITVTEILPLSFSGKSLHFLINGNGGPLYFHDTEENPWSLQRHEFYARDGGKLTSGKFFIQSDDENNNVLVGIDETDSQLMICRQGNIEHGSIKFHPVVNLGDKAVNLACPTHMYHGTEIFYVSPDLDLVEMTEDKADKCWHEKSIETHHPSDNKIESGTSHSMEITAVSEYGNALPDIELCLTSEHPVMAYIDGNVYKLDPTHPVSCKTGHSGKIRLSIKAWELSVPAIHVRIPAISSNWSKSFNIDLALHKRMAGKDTRFEVTAESLKKKNVLHQDVDTHVAKEVADAFTTMGKEILKKAKAADNFDFELLDEPSASVGWHFRFDHPDSKKGLSVNRLSSEELGHYLVNPGQVGFSYEHDDTQGVFDWIGDLLRNAKNFIEKIKDIVITWVDNQLHIVIDGIGQFIAKSVQGFVSTLKLIIQKLAYAFEHAIEAGKAILDFLKTLFEWEDIITTKRVFKHSFECFLNNLIKSVETDAVDLVKGQFQSIHNRVKDDFDEQIGHLRHQNLKGLSTPQSGQHPFDERKIHKHHANVAIQSNFVWHHLDMHMKQDPSFSFALVSSHEENEIKEFFDDLINKIKEENFGASAERILSWLKELRDQDINSILSTGLASILELIKDFLLLSIDLVESALVGLLKLIGKALKAISSILNAPIVIPILSQLYKQMTGDNLTIADVLCLLIAAPGTVFYKLLQFKADPQPPFTKEECVEFKKINLPWGDLKHLVEGPAENSELVLMGSPEDKALKKFISVKHLIVSIATVPQPTLDATFDAAAIANTPLPKLAFFASWYNLYVHIADGPLESLLKNISDRDVHEHMDIVYWSVSFLPVSADVIVSSVPGGRIVRSYNTVGPILDMVLGAADLILGTASLITAILEEKPDYKNIAGGVGQVCSSLTTKAKILIPAIQDDPEPDSKAALFLILMGVDEVCGTANVVCHFISNPYDF